MLKIERIRTARIAWYDQSDYLHGFETHLFIYLFIYD